MRRPGGTSASSVGGEVGVVARRQAEVGDRVGAVGVEAGREEQPGGVERRRERGEDLVDPGPERVAGGARRAAAG